MKRKRKEKNNKKLQKLVIKTYTDGKKVYKKYYLVYEDFVLHKNGNKTFKYYEYAFHDVSSFSSFENQPQYFCTFEVPTVTMSEKYDERKNIDLLWKGIVKKRLRFDAEKNGEDFSMLKKQYWNNVKIEENEKKKNKKIKLMDRNEIVRSDLILKHFIPSKGSALRQRTKKRKETEQEKEAKEILEQIEPIQWIKNDDVIVDKGLLQSYLTVAFQNHPCPQQGWTRKHIKTFLQSPNPPR